MEPESALFRWWYAFLGASLTLVLPLLILGAAVYDLALSTQGHPFRGFLISEGLLVSEYDLPGWAPQSGRVLMGDTVTAVQGERVQNIEELRQAESRFAPGEQVVYTLQRREGLATEVVVVFQKPHLSDLILTFGVMAIAGLVIVLVAPIVFFLSPRRWWFALWLFGFSGALWLLGSYDYHTTYVFPVLTILAGCAIAPSGLFCHVRVLRDHTLSRNDRLLVGLAYLVSFGFGFFHLWVYRHPGAVNAWSLILLWANSAFWCWVIFAMGCKASFAQEESSRSRIRARLALFTYGAFYVLPMSIIVFGHLFHLRVPVNQFVVFFSLFPLAVSALTYTESQRRMRQIQDRLVKQHHFISLGVLASGLAHEINNPLQTLSLNVHLIKKLIGDEPRNFKPAFRDKMEVVSRRMLKAVMRIHDVVNSINSFSKGKLGRSEMIPLGMLLEGTIDSFRSPCAEKEITLTQEGSSLALHVPRVLQMVLVQLLSNAIDAVFRGGAIAVESTEWGPEVKITVRDNGPGILAKDLPHIFDPFFTTKDPGKGMGLGLWISAQLLLPYGGRIEVSQPQQGGTVMEVTLPKVIEAFQSEAA